MSENMRENYEIMEVATGQLVRVNLFDLEIGLKNGRFTTNFGNAVVEEEKPKKRQRKTAEVSDESDEA